MRLIVKGGIVLGAGLGGFLDGIVLHQILGWHHVICEDVTCGRNVPFVARERVVLDGYFHLAMWAATAAGVVMVFLASRLRTPPAAGRSLAGAMIAGWGIFNLVEGLLNHHLLGLHHVLPGHPHEMTFDLLFLASGVMLLALGTWLVRRDRATG